MDNKDMDIKYMVITYTSVINCHRMSDVGKRMEAILNRTERIISECLG